MTKLPEKELLRPDEVAKYFSIHRATVYRWIETERLTAIKVGRLTRITRESVLQIQKPCKDIVALDYFSVL